MKYLQGAEGAIRLFGIWVILIGIVLILIGGIPGWTMGLCLVGIGIAVIVSMGKSIGA